MSGHPAAGRRLRFRHATHQATGTAAPHKNYLGAIRSAPSNRMTSPFR